ncbi:MAG: class I SAM-dependent methyltransferase, partial [Alphaproteobacteria bacterium]
DYYAKKAGEWDSSRSRTDNLDNISASIVKTVNLNETMHLMDFGSGTGLLLERIAPYVSKITASDVSPAMNTRLQEKRGQIACELDIVEIDLEKADIDTQFDGVISSMTMHHIADIEAMFRKFHSMLKDGGFIAIADLDLEDGSFHTDDTGVKHFGFDRDEFAKSAASAGFAEVQISSASVIHRPNGDFPVFLLTAARPPSL